MIAILTWIARLIRHWFTQALFFMLLGSAITVQVMGTTFVATYERQTSHNSERHEITLDGTSGKPTNETEKPDSQSQGELNRLRGELATIAQHSHKLEAGIAALRLQLHGSEAANEKLRTELFLKNQALTDKDQQISALVLQFQQSCCAVEIHSDADNSQRPKRPHPSPPLHHVQKEPVTPGDLLMRELLRPN